MSVHIREAITPQEREAIYRLRYRVYVEEMGRPQHYADHSRQRIEEPLDSHAHLIAAFDQKQVVGTVRVNLGCDGGFGYYADLYSMPRFVPFFPARTSVTTKMIVDPEYRRSTVPIQMAAMGFRIATSRGVVFDFMDCNPPLKPLFERMGYRQLFPNISHPEYGEVHPMVLAGLDLAYLKKVRSPFRDVASELTDLDGSVVTFQHLLTETGALEQVA